MIQDLPGDAGRQDEGVLLVSLEIEAQLEKEDILGTLVSQAIPVSLAGAVWLGNQENEAIPAPPESKDKRARLVILEQMAVQAQKDLVGIEVQLVLRGTGARKEKRVCKD